METTLIRQCEETGEPFVAWGRGRPPTKRGQGRAEDLTTPIGNIGKYIDRDGNIYDERPEAEVKPKRKTEQPYKQQTKPATAKAVKAVRPAAAPAKRIAMPVPPPPPAAVVDGKTLVAALADGDLHPDTFEEPPFEEDGFESLYGDEGVSPGALDEPVEDEYMEQLIAAGILPARALA